MRHDEFAQFWVSSQYAGACGLPQTRAASFGAFGILLERFAMTSSEARSFGPGRAAESVAGRESGLPWLAV